MNRHRAFVVANRDRYDELLAAQNGGCAICNAEPLTRRLHIDHDHATMRLRGLLCHRCNQRLDGGVTLEWLEDAAHYLLYPPAVVLL